MKKILILVVLLFSFSCPIIGEAERTPSFELDYNYCILQLGNNSIEGVVEWWQNYDETKTVQISIDGCIYLTSYENVILIKR